MNDNLEDAIYGMFNRVDAMRVRCEVADQRLAMIDKLAGQIEAWVAENPAPEIPPGWEGIIAQDALPGVLAHIAKELRQILNAPVKFTDPDEGEATND